MTEIISNQRKEMFQIGLSVISIILLALIVLYIPVKILFIITVLFILLLTVLIAASIKFMDKKEGEERLSVIFQVSNNKTRVFRNVWTSDPKTGVGYQAKLQGWRFWVPYVWHNDEGEVNFIPMQLDPDFENVNCTDGNPVKINVRVTWRIRPEKKAAILFTINTEGVDIPTLVRQRVRTALNRSMHTNAEAASMFNPDEKKTFGIQATKIVNDLLANDSPVREKSDNAAENRMEPIDYGLEAVINIENIDLPDIIQAAKGRESAAEIEDRLAVKKANAMKTKITETGANPTAVIIADMLGDFARDLFGGRKGKNNKKEEKGKEGGKK